MLASSHEIEPADRAEIAPLYSHFHASANTICHHHFLSAQKNEVTTRPPDCVDFSYLHGNLFQQLYIAKQFIKINFNFFPAHTKTSKITRTIFTELEQTNFPEPRMSHILTSYRNLFLKEPFLSIRISTEYFISQQMCAAW
jgi:hypothetical protein